jgi:hypothetical protein
VRRGRGGGDASAPVGGAGHLAQLSSALGAAAEPLAATWAKATAALAALAVVTVGTGAATQEEGRTVRGLDDLPLIQALAGPDRDGRAVFQRPPFDASSTSLGLGAGATAGSGSSVSSAVQTGATALGGEASKPSAAGGKRGGVVSELAGPQGSLGGDSGDSPGLPRIPGVRAPDTPDSPAAPRAPEAPDAPGAGGGSGEVSAPTAASPPSAPSAPDAPSAPSVDAVALLGAATG